VKLYRTHERAIVEQDEQGEQDSPQGRCFALARAADRVDWWDELLCSDDLYARARAATEGPAIAFDRATALAPILGQEVWAAGVTYFRSRTARIEESQDAGGGTFYDRVYAAERPELFFKSAGWRVIGSGGTVRIRSDARWSVPEPELTLVVNDRARLVGYTIGNDMSSRDIEGENPLYLPQAKVYNGSCALGPCILLAEPGGEPLAKTTTISIEIERGGVAVFAGETTLAELKRDPLTLIEYLFRDQDFPSGVFLMTGTGIVPGDAFTLAAGDRIRIAIAGIGTLRNVVG
jgi:2-dehydro-3-deoxy-D-arabinonate dehydratase